MAETKWAIIGTGNAAYNFVTCLKTLYQEGHNIVAVGDKFLQAAAKFAQEHDIPRHGSIEDVAADPNVDVAYIANLNPWHYPVAKLMLSAGKHVIVEKPIGMNEREVQEMAQLAKTNKQFLMQAMWSRFFPATDYVRKILDSDQIGNVNMLHIQLGRENNNVDRIQYKELGGGAILDLGIYAMQLVTMVYKEDPIKIVATGHLNKSGCDEAVGAILLYENNRMANIVLSATREFPCEAYIAGDRGSLKIEHPFFSPTAVTRGDEKGNLSRIEFKLPEINEPLHYLNTEGLVYEAKEVRDCLLLKGMLESTLMKNEDSIRMLRIMDEIRRQVGITYSQDKTHVINGA